MQGRFQRKTPCVGICSTTYGDLVCRGCKRFAHEIVQWNGYDETQQNRIWSRLLDLRREVLKQVVEVQDKDLFAKACAELGLAERSEDECLLELLKLLAREGRAMRSVGLAVLPSALNDVPQHQSDALAVLQALDNESYVRSLAHYERNFKVLSS